MFPLLFVDYLMFDFRVSSFRANFCYYSFVYRCSTGVSLFSFWIETRRLSNDAARPKWVFSFRANSNSGLRDRSCPDSMTASAEPNTSGIDWWRDWCKRFGNSDSKKCRWPDWRSRKSRRWRNWPREGRDSLGREASDQPPSEFKRNILSTSWNY